MDGLEATRRIRAWEQEKREYKTPIIALTAHAFQEHRQKTMDAGCTEFLAKPIKKQALINIIDLFAGQRESLIAQPEPLLVTEITPILDEQDSPVQIDPELQDLRPLFLRTVRDFQAQLADAITTQDFGTMQRCGHSLKGWAAPTPWMRSASPARSSRARPRADRHLSSSRLSTTWLCS